MVDCFWERLFWIGLGLFTEARFVASWRNYCCAWVGGQLKHSTDNEFQENKYEQTAIEILVIEVRGGQFDLKSHGHVWF